jgi:hypothetical protein
MSEGIGFAAVCRFALGDRFSLASSEPISGGFAKTTYRVRGARAGEQFVVQVWREPFEGFTHVDSSASELLWPGGPELLEANTAFVRLRGVNAPRIVASFCNRDVCSWHVTVFEYVDAVPLEAMSPEELTPHTQQRIGEALGVLRGYHV